MHPNLFTEVHAENLSAILLGPSLMACLQCGMLRMSNMWLILNVL